MYPLRCSYTGSSKASQWSPLVRLVAVAAIAASLGGCVALLPPLDDTASVAGVSNETTGSISTAASLVDQVDPSDWEAVRRAVAAVSPQTATTRVEWSNPDTGSTGTVATLARPVEQDGTLCRSFATTVNDMRGVRRYRGEACRRSDGSWRLYGMIADDAKFS